MGHSTFLLISRKSLVAKRRNTRRTIPAWAALFINNREASTEREECKVTFSYEGGQMMAQADRPLVFLTTRKREGTVTIRFFTSETSEIWMLEIGEDGIINSLNLAIALTAEEAKP
jgi:hypothetical protein